MSKKLSDEEYLLFLELIKNQEVKAQVEIAKKENKKPEPKPEVEKVEVKKEPLVEKKEDDEIILKYEKRIAELEKKNKDWESFYARKVDDRPDYIKKGPLPGFSRKNS